MAHSLQELEARIGFPPFSKESWQIEAELAPSIEGSAARKRAIAEWVALQGIPYKQAMAAMTTSLAAAYANKNYLITWRNRVNPSLKLLGEENPFDSPEPENQPEAKFSGPAPSAEEMASKLAPVLRTLVTGEVKDQLKDRKLELSQEAKDKIRQIAKESGENLVGSFMADMRQWVEAELAAKIPPQEIVVKNPQAKTEINLGVQHFKFERLLRACNARNSDGNRLNIWLTGPTGSGKTSAPKYVAKALNLPFGADSALDADYKLIGFRNAQGEVVTTIFREIYTKGGIYVADEIDGWHPGATICLNAALANGFCAFPDGIFSRHPDCIIIACANTWGLGATNDYVGRSKLDAATLDRFMPKIDWPYDDKLEEAIALKMDSGFGKHWLAIIRNLRAKAKAQGLKVIISPRATYNGIAMHHAGDSMAEIIDGIIIAGMSPEQAKSIGAVDAKNDEYEPLPIYQRGEDFEKLLADMEAEEVQEVA
jgi:hypothetical protein